MYLGSYGHNSNKPLKLLTCFKGLAAVQTVCPQLLESLVKRVIVDGKVKVYGKLELLEEPRHIVRVTHSSPTHGPYQNGSPHSSRPAAGPGPPGALVL